MGVVAKVIIPGIGEIDSRGRQAFRRLHALIKAWAAENQQPLMVFLVFIIDMLHLREHHAAASALVAAQGNQMRSIREPLCMPSVC